MKSANEQTVADYVYSVLSGDIPAGVLIKGAAQRYLDDLAQQGEPDFPYRFDQRKAEVACDFFPTCLRHSAGSFARKRFELLPWQAFIIWNLFGWVDDIGCRRFRRAFVSVARKNGKSCFAAGVALYMTALDTNPLTGQIEGVPETIIAATQREQSDIIFKEILRMREMSPTIKRRSSPRFSAPTQLAFSHNGGSIRPIASDRAKDGLNPHLVVLDELHAFTHSHQETYQTLQTGSGFRDQSLILTTTTAGDESSHIWAKEHSYAAGIARGDIHDPTVFSACYELDEKDDPLDPANWPKANPSMSAGVLKESYLRDQARLAEKSASDLNVFTRYHGNRLVASLSSAFDMQILDPCFRPLSDWSEADALGAGIDLGSRDDLTALAFCARFKAGQQDGQPLYRYEVRARCYIAGNCKRDLSEQPWPEWIAAGWLKVETHPIETMVGDLINEAGHVDSLAYDPYQAQYLAETLELAGIECASMAQNCSHFNQPIIDLRALAADQRLTIEDNPLVRWCFSNAIAVTNRNNQTMLAKRESKEKIDPCVSILMALRRCMLQPARSVGTLAIF